MCRMSTKTRISFVLPPVSVKRLEQIAELKTATVQDVCRKAIELYLICQEAEVKGNKVPALMAEDGTAERVWGFP